MNVYCVECNKLGLMKVFADMVSANCFLQGAVETHSAYCGKVVWLDANLNGTMDKNKAFVATVCNSAWKSQETFTLTVQSVLKLV